jgi:hypothetical protein
MHNQGVIGRPSLELVDFLDCIAIACIGTQAIYGLGRNGYELSGPNCINSTID